MAQIDWWAEMEFNLKLFLVQVGCDIAQSDSLEVESGM